MLPTEPEVTQASLGVTPKQTKKSSIHDGPREMVTAQRMVTACPPSLAYPGLPTLYTSLLSSLPALTFLGLLCCFPGTH